MVAYRFSLELTLVVMAVSQSPTTHNVEISFMSSLQYSINHTLHAQHLSHRHGVATFTFSCFLHCPGPVPLTSQQPIKLVAAPDVTAGCLDVVAVLTLFNLS